MRGFDAVFLLEGSQTLLRLLKELAVFLTVGIERAMAECLSNGTKLTDIAMGFIRKECVGKALIDIFHRLLRRMQHVFFVETIVAQFVVHDFVGREIVCK